MIVLLSAGCGGYTARTDIDTAKPVFDEAVVPVKDPLQARYRPASLKFRQAVIYGAKEKGLNGEDDAWDEAEPIEIIANGFLDIMTAEASLQWDIKVRKMVISGDTASHPRLPLSHYRMWSDARGRAQRIDVSLPAYDQTGIRDVMSKQRYDELVADARNIARNLIIPFTESPVQSGDVLFRIDKGTLREMLESQFESPDHFKTTAGFKTIDFVLTGWSRYRGNRVLVSTADQTVDFTGPGGRKTYQYRIAGYVLFDPETFCQIKSVLIFSLGMKYRSLERLIRIVKINELEFTE